MPEYITLPVEVDPEDVISDVVTYIQTKWPDWTPADGNLDYWLIRAIAAESAELRELASQVPTAIFRYFGSSILGVAPIDASAATVASTWVVKDDAGYTIPAGTQVGIRSGGDQLFAFETAADVSIDPGDLTTDVGGVTLVAIIEGFDASGIGGTGVLAELIDPLDFVVSVTLTTATTGGTDDEEDIVYLNRLSNYLTLLSPRPILPNDFAVLATSIAGVARATAIDGYNPADSTFNNERMIAVAAIDANGNAVSAGVKQQIDNYLQSLREVNFVVNVIDPTLTTVDVQFTIKALPGFDPAAVADAAEVDVRTYLSPGSWGHNPTSANPSTDTTWTNVTTVRYLEVAQVINNTVGVDYIASLGIRKGAAAYDILDVSITGVAPLPNAGSVVGTGT